MPAILRQRRGGQGLYTNSMHPSPLFLTAKHSRFFRCRLTVFGDQCEHHPPALEALMWVAVGFRESPRTSELMASLTGRA